MTHLIDKSALVVKIERRKNICQGIAEANENNEFTYFYYKGKTEAYSEMSEFLDTLEVKEVDLEKDVRQIFSLYYEGIKHYEDIIKEEREENGGSDLAIKIMDGVVDARELGIQYVIDKLKAQKGESI